MNHVRLSFRQPFRNVLDKDVEIIKGPLGFLSDEAVRFTVTSDNRWLSSLC